MKIKTFETWRCQRKESLFDAARMGRSPMNWDVVVLRLTTDTGLITRPAVAGQAGAMRAALRK